MLAALLFALLRRVFAVLLVTIIHLPFSLPFQIVCVAFKK